jgi:hypothetical protein
MKQTCAFYLVNENTLPKGALDDDSQITRAELTNAILANGDKQFQTNTGVEFLSGVFQVVNDAIAGPEKDHIYQLLFYGGFGFAEENWYLGYVMPEMILALNTELPAKATEIKTILRLKLKEDLAQSMRASGIIDGLQATIREAALRGSSVFIVYEVEL